MIQQLQRKIILCLRYCRKVENRTELLMTEVIIHQHANKQRKKNYKPSVCKLYVSIILKEASSKLEWNREPVTNPRPTHRGYLTPNNKGLSLFWVFNLKRLRPTTKSLHSSRIKESCELNYYWQYNYLQVICMARAMVSTRALFSSSDSPDNS